MPSLASTERYTEIREESMYFPDGLVSFLTNFQLVDNGIALSRRCWVNVMADQKKWYAVSDVWTFR